MPVCHSDDSMNVSDQVAHLPDAFGHIRKDSGIPRGILPSPSVGLICCTCLFQNFFLVAMPHSDLPCSVPETLPVGNDCLADVVLPLALPGAYTYALPQELAGRVSVGSRVVVPLGKRKYYSAIVIRRPGTPPPAGAELKSITDVVDEAPLLLPQQIKLWRWMARYYLCMPGEVMKAALPAGLKLESEMLVEAAPEFTAEDYALLSAREKSLVDALAGEKAVNVATLEKKIGLKSSVLPLLRRLMEAGAVKVHEAMGRTLRPRTEIHVRAADFLRDEQQLRMALEDLKRSQKQKAVLLSLLSTGEMSKKALSDTVDGAAAAVPALRRKGLVEVFPVAVDRLKSHAADAAFRQRPLSGAQQEACDELRRLWQNKDVCLLHGVTSSGKTEIYIRLIEETIARGLQVLYLVPEIALTTQITDRLGRVFGEHMGVYHSKFPDAWRAELWQRQLTDRAFPLILGVRSSLFLPFRRLGLVIVDEEHETSYKQQDPAPRYNARDAAMVLAREYGAKVLLGTATPSVETYYNATVAGKYGIVSLTARYGDVQLPEIVVEDVKELRRKKLMKTPLSPRLIEEVRQALADGEQTILFQNRRGYAPVLECRTCGWTPRCTACDVSLTFHQHSGKLVCHYCGAHYDVPRQCPNCEDTDLRDIGYGTEKIEAEVKTLFPQARVTRMDLDTTRSRAAYERIINDFERGDTDLLIGTQMVTKGLDFDRVRVVGILSADQMLSQPNFRAYERAYHMMAQVAGRAGRRGRRGIVVLQTRQPDLSVIHQVTENNYAALFGQQLVEREMFRYPPFRRITDIYLRHRNEQVCAQAADYLAALLRPHFGDDLLGPDKPAVGRVQMLHIRKLLLKLRPELPVSGVRRTLAAARDLLLAQPEYKGVRLHFDVDPL